LNREIGPPHRRRRHRPRPRGPDPPRRCSPSRTTRRMDLRCAATSASTSSPRAGWHSSRPPRARRWPWPPSPH